MRGHDWFIVGIRLLGAWFLGQSAIYLVTFLDLHLGMTPLPDARITNPDAYLLYVGGYLFVALAFLFGAGLLARLCYGRANTESGKRPFTEDDE